MRDADKAPATEQPADPATGGLDFIRARVAADVAAGRNDGRVVTRFPPEPNGYLHIGHAKSICLNFGLAHDYDSWCNLRYDDTNPLRENGEFVRAIAEDVRWLGFDPGERVFFASDYFEQLYEWALVLIRKGAAYVCSLSSEEMARMRGTLTEPGQPSPGRERSVEENLDLFARMRAGEFPDGAHSLRARIDMASGNLNLRDPVIYRIRHVTHHRTGDAWCIYPTYDYTHGQSDAIEGVTHSLCTLEFEDHRPLYDWFLEQLEIPRRPQQIEFARLNLTHTVLSKRRLAQLVDEGHVEGWSDPRMPTLAGLRRRGYPPAAIRDFCERIGISKANATTDLRLLEFCVREELNRTAPRAMAVLDPLRLVIENWPEDRVEWLDAENNPEDPDAGSRRIPFSRELWIERDDFREEAPPKWFRLAPGREVRLKHACYVTLTDVIRDEAGQVMELRATYDPKSMGGWTEDGRKVKGTLHWVCARHAVAGEVRLLEPLFARPDPDDLPEGGTWLDNLNPDSSRWLQGCQLEPMLGDLPAGTAVQFLRLGYFVVDSPATPAMPVRFNRIVSLKDSWARQESRGS